MTITTLVCATDPIEHLAAYLACVLVLLGGERGPLRGNASRRTIVDDFIRRRLVNDRIKILLRGCRHVRQLVVGMERAPRVQSAWCHPQIDRCIAHMDRLVWRSAKGIRVYWDIVRRVFLLNSMRVGCRVPIERHWTIIGKRKATGSIMCLSCSHLVDGLHAAGTMVSNGAGHRRC